MRPFNRVGNILNKMIDRQFHTMPDESKRKWKGQLENTKNTVALQHESPACIWHLQGVNYDQNYQNSRIIFQNTCKRLVRYDTHHRIIGNVSV